MLSVYLTYGRGTLAQHVSAGQAIEIVAERDDAFVSQCDCDLCRKFREDYERTSDAYHALEVKHVQGL
jgi:hypothetical protein